MSGILASLAAIGIFLVGLLARLGVFLLVLAALLVPALLLAGAAKALRAAAGWAKGYRSADALRFRKGLRYAPGHTWLRPEGQVLRVGLDDLAQKLLPWAVAVDLPRPGRRVAQGERVARVCCGSHEAHLAAPVAGTVVAVNPRLARHPSLLKSRCYGAGWLLAIEPEGAAWKALPGGEAARQWLAEEGRRLARFYEAQLGIASADGGDLTSPPAVLLGEPQWNALMREFLRT